MIRWYQGVIALARVRLVSRLLRLLPRVTPKRTYSGMPVYLGLVDPEEMAAGEKHVRLAIACIAEYDPRRFARLKRDLRGILIYPFSQQVTAAYNRSTRFCELSPSAAISNDWLHTACLIVHEGTHARFSKVRRDDPDARVRIERACLSQEIVFLEIVPTTDAIGRAARVETRRTSIEGLREEDYTNAALFYRYHTDWMAATNAWKIARPKSRSTLTAPPKEEQ
jgi:hypothetical protein